MRGFPPQVRRPSDGGGSPGQTVGSAYFAQRNRHELGIHAALRESERSGLGQRLDIPQQESSVTLSGNAVVNCTVEGVVAQPPGNAHPFERPDGRFRCSDGHVFFGPHTDKPWREACEVFGEPGLADDPEIDTMAKRFDDAVCKRRTVPILARRYAHRSRDELEPMAGDRLALTPVRRIDDVAAVPHLAARGRFGPVDVAGVPVQVFGSPIRLSATPPRTRGARPAVGEHSRQVYVDWLGLDLDRCEALRAAGVI